MYALAYTVRICLGCRQVHEGSTVPQETRLALSSIVDAAIDLADDGGLEALSMRRLAETLGVGTMSLYRHVSDRGTLVQEMTEEVGRRFAYPAEPPESWRTCIETVADIDWRLYQRHPWVVLAYSMPRHGFGASSLRCLDWLVGGLADGLDVDVDRATEMALTVWCFVNGAALGAVSHTFVRSLPDDEGPSGLDDLLAGRLDDPPARLATLAGRPGTERLTDPRARLDAGIATLCAGFAAQAG